MKEFAIGALVIAAVTGVVAGIFIALAPLGALNPNPAPVMKHASYGLAGNAAVAFIILVATGVVSGGVGAGVLNELKNRKRK